MDLIVPNEWNDFVAILMNNGDGTFASPTTYGVSHAVNAVTGDLDGDGDNDLCVTSPAGGDIYVFKNNGDGTFASEVTYSGGSQPTAISCGDVDNDGDMDIMVTNAYSGTTVSVLKNNGDATFGSPSAYTVGSQPYSIFSADLDGDGYIDIVAGNSSSSNVSVIMNNGDGTFGTQTTYSISTLYSVGFCSDLDGDGDIDIITANGGSHNISVLENNGDGTFAGQVTYAAGNGPTSVFSSDLDGDGDMDLCVANNSANSISVLLNRDIEPPTVTVTAPNTRQYFNVDSTTTITYTASDNIGIASVSAYWGFAGVFTKIDSVTGNPGSITWNIPNIPNKDNIWVKVYAYDSSGNSASDVSDAWIGIRDYTKPTVTVTTPNGGEYLPAGSTKAIKFTASDNIGIASVSAYYIIGTNITKIDSVVGAPDSINWYVPNIVSNNVWIKVYAYDASGNKGYDASNASFKIRDKSAPTVTVISPNGGEYWRVNTTHQVKFTATDNIGVTKIAVYYIIGTNATRIDSVNSDVDSVSWTLPATASNNVWLKVYAYDNAGNKGNDASNASFKITDPTPSMRIVETPDVFALSQNYPNPFNPETVISYQIPMRDASSEMRDNPVSRIPYPVSLKIYSITGQLVRTLVHREQSAGYYNVKWDGKDDNGNEVTSGIYIYRIIAGEFVQTRRAVLMK